MSSEDWQSPEFRQRVVIEINEMLQTTGSDKNATVMEDHMYKKARNKDEYLGLVARLFVHFKEMISRSSAAEKPLQPPNADMGNTNVMNLATQQMQNMQGVSGQKNVPECSLDESESNK